MINTLEKLEPHKKGTLFVYLGNGPLVICRLITILKPGCKGSIKVVYEFTSLHIYYDKDFNPEHKVPKIFSSVYDPAKFLKSYDFKETGFFYELPSYFTFPK